MDKSWMKAYQEGPEEFNHHIHSYKPKEAEQKRLEYEKSQLDREIRQRFDESEANQQYQFPRRHVTSQQSVTSTLNISQYNLHNQNPGLCSFERCFGRSGREAVEANRSKSARKILQVGKVKERLRGSVSKRKRKRNVEVREIHLTSTVREDSQASSIVRTPSKSTIKLMTGIKRKIQKNQDSLDSPRAIKIVNKPQVDNTMKQVPTSQTLLSEAQASSCFKLPCKWPSTSDQQRPIGRRPMTKRPPPDIRRLVVQKRQIKILTSNEFNQRRNHSNSLWKERDMSTERKTMAETRKVTASNRVLVLKN